MDREVVLLTPQTNAPREVVPLCSLWAIIIIKIIKIVNAGLNCWAVLACSFVWQLSTADHLNGSQELGETLACALRFNPSLSSSELENK